jgi:hypothetical protein
LKDPKECCCVGKASTPRVTSSNPSAFVLIFIISSTADKWNQTAQDEICQSKKYMGVFAKNAAPRVSSKMILDQFVPSLQIVVPKVLVLQVVVLNCTSNTSYGTKSVYSS